MPDDSSFSVHVFRCLDAVTWRDLRTRSLKGSVDPWDFIHSGVAVLLFEDLGLLSLAPGTPFYHAGQLDRWGLPEGCYVIYVPASTRARYIGPAWQFADY